MRDAIAEYRPNRVAVDSLSALERVTSVRSFREFVIGLTSFLKQEEIAGLFTSTTASLLGGSSVTEKHISTLTDTIILLRYVETRGRMRRALTVLKMRGSAHDHDIREYVIEGRGMRLGDRFRDLTGVLSGNLTQLPSNGDEDGADGGA
jgi:circadian clock protein KaiC